VNLLDIMFFLFLYFYKKIHFVYLFYIMTDSDEAELQTNRPTWQSVFQGNPD